jgi:hypothetical protein
MDIFRICGVEGYVKGTLLRSDPAVDPEGAGTGPTTTPTRGSSFPLT